MKWSLVDAAVFAASMLLVGCLGAGGPLWAMVPLNDRAHLRRPVAGAWLKLGETLAIANQRSGSISIVDTKRRVVVTETRVGERLADVAALTEDGWFVAADENAHELLLLHWDGDEVQVAERIAVGRYPADIAVSPNRTRFTVASRWSRTVTTFLVERDGDDTAPLLVGLSELPLTFAPGTQLFLPDGEHVFVADAFAGQMALLNLTLRRVVDYSAKRIVRIYGMALSPNPDAFYIGHQTVQTMRSSRQTRAVVGDEAMSLTNIVGQYSIPRLLEGRLEPSFGDGPRMIGYFTGDLRQMADLVPVTLSVKSKARRQLLNPGPGEPLVRIGRFRDEIMVADRPRKQNTIRLGPVGTLSAADRGEALFYNANLSANGWMSCHSCHPDGHTTGQLVDTLGDGSRRTHKRVLTLLGSGSTGRWAWTGAVEDLHRQVLSSLQTTMGKRASKQTVRDLTAFVRTLPPPPPLEPPTGDPEDSAQLDRGEALFGRLGCAECHVPAAGYTSDATYDVGLQDEHGLREFNPPSLRGVSQGYTFFHDGRAEELEDVFVTHRHPNGKVIPGDQLQDLLRFLRSL